MSKVTNSLVVTIGLVAGVFFGSASCDEADEIYDCQAICSRYQTCFDSKYDVGACRSKCRDKSSADDQFRAKANLCEACIDEKSCTGSFACVAECSGIVP